MSHRVVTVPGSRATMPAPLWFRPGGDRAPRHRKRWVVHRRRPERSVAALESRGGGNGWRSGTPPGVSLPRNRTLAQAPHSLRTRFTEHMRSRPVASGVDGRFALCGRHRAKCRRLRVRMNTDARFGCSRVWKCFEPRQNGPEHGLRSLRGHERSFCTVLMNSLLAATDARAARSLFAWTRVASRRGHA